MTAMTAATANRKRSRRATAALVLVAICAAVAVSGCGTSQPRPILAGELAEAQTFPYYRVYWVGPSFEGHTLSAADGLRSYLDSVGDSVFYGDCVHGKGIFGGGSCLLPLQVTTLIYHLHSNKALGPQRNIVIRGVPAVVYDEGRSLELYTGHVAVDTFSNSLRHALRAAQELYPINAQGSSKDDLPLPVYCPGLYGPQEIALARVTDSLPGQVCEHAARQLEYLEGVKKAGTR
jgi:hypothetical protein